MDVSDPDQSGQIRLGDLSLVTAGEVMDTICRHSVALHFLARAHFCFNIIINCLLLRTGYFLI